ncbi:MAG TPA: OmpA family protein [Pseudolabrys sp.]|nr:OmpA family protein [Pseudolabrys sp.]
MTSTKSLLLAGTALLMLAAAAPAAHAGAVGGRIVIAQAAPQHEGDKDKEKEKKAPEKGKPTPQPHQAQPKPPEQKPAAQQQPPHEAPKTAQPAPQPKAEPKHEEKRQETQKPEPKPSTAVKPAPQKEKENQPAAAEHKPEQKPAAAEKKLEQKPAATEKKPEQKPAAQEQPKHEAPAAQTKPAAPGQPPAAVPAPAPQKPAAQSAPAQAPASNAQTNAPAKPNTQTAAPAPPQKPQSAQQFILPKNGKPTVTIQDVRKDRHETREGNRTVITEGDRTIVKQDNRTIIRHNETQRFAVGARDVNVEHKGNETTTVIVRPDGDRIVNVTDERGHLIRRVRRERGGREVVIIDERSAGPRRDMFVELPPPVIRIPRDRYIVELDRARPETVYEVLDAAPVETVEETYTVDQVRYSAPLRERMPRVDLDINFDTGSWQLTPEQIDKLSVVAEGLNRAVRRNPREVFLIEGHTDAVGNDEDNLSLSDRRAESVAVALTEQFHVPPENLVTQGYGEQSLKVQTEGASRANRRVSVRRITPLIDKQAAR